MDEFTKQLAERLDLFITANCITESLAYKIGVNYAGKLRKTYFIDDFCISTLKDDGPTYISIQLPKYMIRLYFLCELHRVCRKLKLDVNLIKFYKEEKEVDLFDLIKFDVDEDGLKKEKQLNDLLLKIYKELEQSFSRKSMNKFDDEAEEQGLLYSLNILKGLLI